MKKKQLTIGDKVSLNNNNNIFFVREKHKPKLIGVSKTMDCPASGVYDVLVKEVKEIIK